ncbi:biofilm-dependent modulation protein [Escherichia coli]
MFTYYQAENSTAEPAVVDAMSKAFRHSTVLSLKSRLMELTKWVEASDNDILSDIYQQTINYVVSGQHPSFKVLCLIGNLIWLARVSSLLRFCP